MEKGLAGELLPTIRKTGGYIPTKADDTDVDILAWAPLTFTPYVTEILQPNLLSFLPIMVKHSGRVCCRGLVNENRDGLGPAKKTPGFLSGEDSALALRVPGRWSGNDVSDEW